MIQKLTWHAREDQLWKECHKTAIDSQFLASVALVAMCTSRIITAGSVARVQGSCSGTETCRVLHDKAFAPNTSLLKARYGHNLSLESLRRRNCNFYLETTRYLSGKVCYRFVLATAQYGSRDMLRCAGHFIICKRKDCATLFVSFLFLTLLEQGNVRKKKKIKERWSSQEGRVLKFHPKNTGGLLINDRT